MDEDEGEEVPLLGPEGEVSGPSLSGSAEVTLCYQNTFKVPARDTMSMSPECSLVVVGRVTL